ncbi:hypothetical protein NDU88_007464 [Pleurodeles waltl]|uniref:Uncharacterized protein n=1 Tax=Pleurodeles waltl TaxID=8319 RepID=A0AAV7SSK3_PLEWA|nr:hypothetical protein NDU88_007464 [Pleurodeles waltl]
MKLRRTHSLDQIIYQVRQACISGRRGPQQRVRAPQHWALVPTANPAQSQPPGHQQAPPTADPHDITKPRPQAARPASQHEGGAPQQGDRHSTLKHEQDSSRRAEKLQDLRRGAQFSKSSHIVGGRGS